MMQFFCTSPPTAVSLAAALMLAAPQPPEEHVLLSNEGMTALHDACNEADTDFQALKRLLDEGSDPNARTADGQTPMMIAARYHSREDILQLLIDRGADVNATDARGLSVLHYATGFVQEIRNPTAIGLLISSGAKLDARSKNGWTPLMASAIAPGSDSLEGLLQFVELEGDGADAARAMVNQTLPDGWTPLMLAVASVTPDAWLRWDQEIGVPIGRDAQGDQMLTGMQSTWAKLGYVGRVWSLLAAGADPDAKAVDGTTVDTLLKDRTDPASKAIRALIATVREDERDDPER